MTPARAFRFFIELVGFKVTSGVLGDYSVLDFAVARVRFGEAGNVRQEKNKKKDKKGNGRKEKEGRKKEKGERERKRIGIRGSVGRQAA